MRRRLTEIEQPKPCCVCGNPTHRGDEIVGVVVPWCDFDWRTYVVRRTSKPNEHRRAKCSS